MKLTKKKALEECEKLWRWLEENPGEIYKADWPGWNDYIEKFDSAPFSCPCCHYTEPYAESSWYDQECSKCPLKGFWTNKDIDLDEDEPCTQKDSPFWRWDEARTPRTRKKYAKIIADECARLLIN